MGLSPLSWPRPAFLPGKLFFFPLSYKSLFVQLYLLRWSPCPSAPPGAGGCYGCAGTHRSLVQAPSPSLKTQKSGTEQSPAPLSQRELTQAPSLAAARKQPAKPTMTGTQPPSSTALTSALPPRGYSRWATGQVAGCNTYPSRIWPCFVAWG